MNDDCIRDDTARHESDLQRIAEKLGALVCDLLADVPHVDRVSVRAMAPRRFAAEECEVLDDDERESQEPSEQIPDQIGARVVVHSLDDIECVGVRLEKYFQPVERRDIGSGSRWKYGRGGRHWIFALPDDIVAGDVDPATAPRFFELRVETLFQHAWSGAFHGRD